MRKLIVSALASADGVHGNPHEWAGEYADEEAAAQWLAVLLGSDAMLMGRNTYQLFARLWSTPEGPYLQRLYDIRKYVFSSTLTAADEWNNTQLIAGDPVPAVRELKEQGDGDLIIYGYGQLGHTLLENGLVDQYDLIVNPVVLGGGPTLLHPGKRANLRLQSVAERGNGVVTLSYTTV